MTIPSQLIVFVGSEKLVSSRKNYFDGNRDVPKLYSYVFKVLNRIENY